MTAAVGMNAFVEMFRAIPTRVFIAESDGRAVYANLSAEEDFGPVDEIGSIPGLFGPPFDALLLDRLTRSIGERATVSRTVDGRTRFYSGYTLPVEDRGHARVALFLHEVTDQLRAQREAAALARVAAATAFAGSLESTMDALAQAVVEATGSDACSVVLFDKPPHGMRFLGSHGLVDGYGREFERIWSGSEPLPDAARRLEEFSAGRVVTRGARMALLADPQWAVLHPLLRRASWDNMVSTPLRFQGRLLGALTCYYANGRDMAEEDDSFIRAVADQAAVALENARLILEVRQKAILEERQRLARELHDSVSQALYAIGLGARTALVQLDRNPEAARDPLAYVASLAEGALAEMRALIFELRPDDLDREGLVAALRRHTHALRLRHGLAVDEEMCEEPAMTPATRLALYRIGQEALHNVVRHAQARSVRVVLSCDARTVRLEIGDDGTGFDPEGSYPGHLGLRSMRERIERAGGRFVIESRPGQGTRVVAEGSVDGNPGAD
jgi:signal transduction histidine kinase